MTRNRVLIATGILLYLCFTIVTLPARVVLPRVLPDTMTLDGIEGSVWSGTAQSLRSGRLSATDIQWDFRLLRLFRLQLAYFVELQIPGGFARGVVALQPGSVALSNVSAGMPVAELARLIAPMNLRGQASIEIASARIVEQWPTRLDAVIRLGNINLNQASEIALGDFQLVFDPADANAEEIVGKVSDLDALLDVDGRVKLLPERGYEVDLRVLPADAERERFDRMLRLVPKDEDGRYQLSLSGSL